MRRAFVIAIAAGVGALTSVVRVEPFRTEVRFWDRVAGRVSAESLASDVHRAVGVWPDSVVRCGPSRLYIYFGNPPFGRHWRPTTNGRMVDSTAYQYTKRAALAAWSRDRAINVNDTVFVDVMIPGVSRFWPAIDAGYHFAESERPLVGAPVRCETLRDSIDGK